VNGAIIHNCQATNGAGIFLGIAKDTKDILFMNNDLRKAAQPLKIANDVAPKEVIGSGNVGKRKPAY